MEQIVRLEGRIAEVMPMQSGVSQRTGNQWKSQEYLFEYFSWSGAQYPNRIVVRIFGEEDIAKFNLKALEEHVTLTLRFAASKSQDGTRWFNEIRVTNVERPASAQQPAGESAGTAANQQQQAPAGQQQAGSPGTNATGVVTPPAVGQAQEQQIQYDADGNPVDGDDLPF